MKKGNYKRTPDYIVKQIQDLHASGLNKTQVANKLGLAVSVVCLYTVQVRRRLKPEDKIKIAELYALGKTQIEIGEIIGFSGDTVARVTKTLPKERNRTGKYLNRKQLSLKNLKRL